MDDTRTETDSLGSFPVPAKAYWGIHTERARGNFPFSGNRTSPALIAALAVVKKAAAQANHELGYLTAEKAEAIERACEDVIDGRLADQFPLPALQGGAGTSTHMNVNEVIAHRASERMGGPRGAGSLVSPLADVNRHQSTNDVYPTALRIAAIRGCRALSGALAETQGAFQKKESAFARIVKMGRTETQDAVPLTLGAEFGAFAEALARDRWRTFKCEERLRTINLGGTAIGTGLTAPRDYIFLVTEKLRALTGLPLGRAENTVEATANADTFVEVSGILKAHASTLTKVCGDLRWMNAVGEIRLEKRQAGSSLMPGKINPVIAEAGIQVGLAVMANDFLITEAVSRSTFQICEFLPTVAAGLLDSLDRLVEFHGIFAGHVARLEADESTCQSRVDHAPSLITAFLPQLGYDGAETVLAEWRAAGAPPFRGFLEKRLGQEMVRTVLSPERLMALGYRHESNA